MLWVSPTLTMLMMAVVPPVSLGAVGGPTSINLISSYTILRLFMADISRNCPTRLKKQLEK